MAYDFSTNFAIFEEMTWSFGHFVTAGNPICDAKVGLFNDINVALLVYT